MLKLKNTIVIFQKPVRSLSTVQPLCASRYYNAKIALTQKKGTMRGMDRLLRQEFQKKSREETKGPKSTPKNPVMYDTNKTRVFNRQFMENIGQALAGIPDFLGHGISITKVNVKSDFSEVRVFWVSSQAEPDVVQKLFAEHLFTITKSMYRISGLGQIPKVAFVLDTEYLYLQQMDQLFAELEKQPGHVENKEHSENIWKVAADSFILDSDGGGFDRDAVIKNILQEVEKSKALHRLDTKYSKEDFETAYRESVNRNGLPQKEEMKRNIKSFLNNRKKQLKVVKKDEQIKHETEFGN